MDKRIREEEERGDRTPEHLPPPLRDGPRHKTYRQISPCTSRTAPESLHHPNHPDSLHHLDRLQHPLEYWLLRNPSSAPL
ncbi:unnamed protein product [Gadus morhua 'NCC']